MTKPDDGKLLADTFDAGVEHALSTAISELETLLNELSPGDQELASGIQEAIKQLRDLKIRGVPIV